MPQPMRIIYTDTLTGETDWADVFDQEFDAGGLHQAIGDKFGEGWTECDTSLVSWALDGYGSTACFILRLDKDLIHGVVYTRFDHNHNPLK